MDETTYNSETKLNLEKKKTLKNVKKTPSQLMDEEMKAE